jgi:hypothetical protein
MLFTVSRQIPSAGWSTDRRISRSTRHSNRSWFSSAPDRSRAGGCHQFRQGPDRAAAVVTIAGDAALGRDGGAQGRSL